MKGREYLMAGHGGAKRHFRRFAIAYWTGPTGAANDDPLSMLANSTSNP